MQIDPFESTSGEPSGRTIEISADGGTAVGSYNNGSFTPQHAFVWSGTGGFQFLGTLDPAHEAERFSVATAVANHGSVVAGYSQVDAAGPEHAFRWTPAGGMADLGPGRALAMADDGRVIVGEQGGSAARWTEGGQWQVLAPYDPSAPLNPLVGMAVSADGNVVVGQARGYETTGTSTVNRDRAYRWTAGGGVQDLGTLPGDKYSAATTMSADGSIVVGISSPDPFNNDEPGGLFPQKFNGHAFYWTEAGGMQNLEKLLVDRGIDMSGFDLWGATSISADGKWIVAAGARTSNRFERIDVLLSLTEGSRNADFDGNGDVDGADLTAWRAGAGIGSGAGRSQGDGNGDEIVNGDDFLLWQLQLGSKAFFPRLAASPGRAVPESAAGGMAALALGAILLCRREPSSASHQRCAKGQYPTLASAT